MLESPLTELFQQMEEKVLFQRVEEFQAKGVFLYILNKSFIIVPIHKGGAKREMQNYLPI
jgi:hypothetical protein